MSGASQPVHQRIRWYRGALLLLVAVACAQLGADRPRGLADVVDVRHWSYADYTRVVVELSEPADAKLVHLGPNPGAGKSERLYFDLEGFWVGRDYASGIPVGDGLLRAVRLGQNTRRNARVVIDVENYSRHRLLVLTHPNRLVVDVYGHRSPTAGDRERRHALDPALRDVRTIVVDAGHGGTDPGATGIGGLREKDVTLRLARALRAKLEADGFRVVLTRGRDRTVSLEERTAIAEASNGDVFVSLHANAAPRRSVQGIETYYLDENHERHSRRVASRENGVTWDQIDDLQRTLSRLRLGAISPRSRQLASLVQGQLTRELRGFGPVEDLGAKKGPFYVLFLSNMPSILVEAGFLTNRVEAGRLRSAEYVDSVAARIAEGVARYRDGGEQVADRRSP